MKMNRVETMLMNNPIRALMQRWVEGPLLERLGGRVEGQRVLEVGCGRGVGTKMIFERFGAHQVVAFDLDPDMVAKARRRLSAYLPDRLQLFVGDATVVNAEDKSFDAVFDFAIIHHIPNWQVAISEICRVLKPEGRFFFMDVTKHALSKWYYRAFMVHPEENRFSSSEFIAEIERQGIIVNGNFVEKHGGDFIFGVGKRR